MNLPNLVCDSGPILHLFEAGALDLLATAERIAIPPMVDRELSRLIRNWTATRPGWLRTEELAPAPAEQATQWQNAGILHEGEAQALALALQRKADWFLTDDAAARVLANSLKVETHGSLGVVLWSAGQGHLDQPAATAKLEALFQSSLWISMRVRTEARNALAQMYR